MNREIEFRAKPDKAYFFESDNVPTTDGFVFGTPDTRMLNVPCAEKWRKEHEMVDQPSIVAMTRDGWPCSVAVQEETIGEFTGMRDKHGVKIYEGDIIKHPYVDPIFRDLVEPKEGDGVTSEVVFHDGAFVVKYDENDFIYLDAFTRHGCVEVIGNIYDNPELLSTK